MKIDYAYMGKRIAFSYLLCYNCNRNLRKNAVNGDVSMKINGVNAEIELIRSNRKTLAIQIHPDGRIIACAPLKMKPEDIEKFILSKSEWIGKQLQCISENTEKLEQLEPFSADDICKMADEALQIIPERVKHYAKIIGVTYGRITIRNQRSKWGSCSSKGNLNFNCLLTQMPPEVLDSVVVHELCHRKHMNHSKEFYAEVYKAFPEYDKWNQWLKENGDIFIRRMIEK